MLLQKEETEPGMDKLKSIVYTIANLQDEINEKTVLTQRLLEENQKLKGELAMLKNEINPEKPDVPLNKNDAFQKVQKRRVQEKR